MLLFSVSCMLCCIVCVIVMYFIGMFCDGLNCIVDLFNAAFRFANR